MAMDAPPTSTLEMIQTQFLLRFTKATFDRPAAKGDSQNPTKRPTIAAGHPIGKKKLRFVGQDVPGNDKGVLIADQFFSRGLTPTGMPFDLPNFRATRTIASLIFLGSLLGEAG